MEINKINNLQNAKFSSKEKEKQSTNSSKSINSFSLDYCNAIKSRNLSNITFKGNDEKTLEEKIAQLKKQIIIKHPKIDKEDIEIFFKHYVAEHNIDIAQKAFLSDRIPFNYAKGITKYSNSENKEVAHYMIDSEDFPLENMEDILIATNKNSAKSVLAACKNKNFPKDKITDIIAKINIGADGAAQYLFMDEEFLPQLALEAIEDIDYTNAEFIEKICANGAFPAVVIQMLAPTISSIPEDVEDYYQLLLDSGLTEASNIANAMYGFHVTNYPNLVKVLNTIKDDFNEEEIGLILKTTHQYNFEGRIALFETLRNDNYLGEFEKICLANVVNNYNISYKMQAYNLLTKNPKVSGFYVLPLLEDIKQEEVDDLLTEKGLTEFLNNIETVELIHLQMVSNPDLYINGEYEEEEDKINDIDDVVITNISTLLKMSKFLGKEGLDALFRQRLDNATEYIEKYAQLEPSEKEKLEKLANLKKPDGTPLNPKDKIDCIDLVSTCSGYYGLDEKINEAISNGYLDIESLGYEILLQILEDCELHTGEIGKHNEEQLKLWDYKQIPLLAQEFYEMVNQCDTSMIALIGSMNQGINLFEYMHDKDNEFGLANALTMHKFAQANMDYLSWIKPDKKHEVQFKYKDSNQEKIAQIAFQIEEDIEILRHTPAKRFIDTHFENCLINSNKFRIPEKYTKNKQTLQEFAKNLFNLLDKNVFSRAEKNLQNESKKENAQLTMTIKSHLEQRIEDISKIGISKGSKQYDLTIKTWDRFPQKDLFQGNYSTCCIGMSKGNGRAMPHYLLNSMFNMIELVDNKTNNTIGNALCYFIQTKDNKIVFVVDNIEIANKHKPSDFVGLKIREAILEYCKNILKDVCPNKDVKICIGNLYNDIPTDDLDEFNTEYQLYGNFDCDEIYLDAFKGWSNGIITNKDDSLLLHLN